MNEKVQIWPKSMVGTAKYTIMENQNQSPPIDVNNTKKYKKNLQLDLLSNNL